MPLTGMQEGLRVEASVEGRPQSHTHVEGVTRGEGERGWRWVEGEGAGVVRGGMGAGLLVDGDGCLCLETLLLQSKASQQPQASGWSNARLIDLPSEQRRRCCHPSVKCKP